MPNRIIREAINNSERVDRLSLQAELFYRRLLNVVDDFGRFDARPAILIAACYPLRAGSMKTEEVEAMLRECVAGDRPLIIVYTADGKPYLEVQDFRQQVRSNKSKYPDPRSADAQHVTRIYIADAAQAQSVRTPYSESKTETYKHTCASADAHARLDDAHMRSASHALGGLPPVDDARFDPVGGDGADWSLSPEQPKKDRGADRDAWFEEFWERYRCWRGTDKKRAKQVFLRVAKARETFNAIIEGLDAQTAEMLRRPPDKRPHASTWLAGERWNDQGAKNERMESGGYPGEYRPDWLD